MLAIVPARGGSRGVRRKNLRNVAGRPLLLHTLEMLRKTQAFSRVVVSTEDAEIASVVRLHGFEVVDRPPRLAADDTTIGEVAAYTTELLGWAGEVGVFQPTSPTLTFATVIDAVREFRTGGYASLGSVTPDAKLRWDVFGPLYGARVNRQQADLEWRETGGIQLARACPVGDTDPLVGNPHHLFEVPAAEAHDIDTPDDLEAARRTLGRKRITISLAASKSLGAGHLFRCLSIGEELAHHDLRFALGDAPNWAFDRVQQAGFRPGFWYEPDLVISDALDTTAEQVAGWKAKGAKVVTLEDLGDGSGFADLVVNELYDDRRPNVESGPRWAVLRPEFLSLPPVEVRNTRKVVVLFGGTDPAHLSERVSRVAAREALVTVLLGPGAEPREFVSGVEVRTEGSVAELVRSADLVVTSAGRTVHEVAACGVPVVSIAANERESRHSHCPGVLRLPVHVAVSDEQIQETVGRLLASPELRAEMAATARAAVDGLGARRIAHRVEGILEGL